MEISPEKIKEVVKEIVERMTKKEAELPEVKAGAGDLGVFPNVEEAIEAARIAQRELFRESLEKRSKYIEAMREASIREAESLAKLAWEETGMGRWEDKVQKNLLAAQKTPGVEDLHPIAYTGDHGLTLVEMAPFGVIGAVVPSTNPSSTIINNSISIIAAGNSVVFAPHPAAKKVSLKSIQILNEAIIKAGGPANLMTTAAKPSIEEAQTLFRHPKIKLILVTGGPAVVKAAMACGKKVIAAGPGNPPVVVDETSDLEHACDSIIKGASFDNGVLCTAEKEIIAVEAIADRLLELLRKDPRTYELKKEEFEKLTKAVILEPGGPGKEPKVSREYIGKDATLIASKIGIKVPESVRLLFCEVDRNHSYIWTEQLMPVIPFVRVKDVNEAISFAVEVEQGNKHTAIMHSLNVANLTKMAKTAQVSIFVKNAPSYAGLGYEGEGYATMSIATPTGEGLTKASTFTRPLRCVLVDYFRIA
ncbi:aldehyde dehydrogenase EutE [bacterium]|nr:aldehyde dehydrogenase EutE [bacterium]